VKRILLVTLLIALGSATLFPAHSAGEETVTLVVDGARLKPDTPPVIVNGRVMVPIRFVSEALGCLVYWDEATRTVYVVSPPSPPAQDTGDTKEPGLRITAVDHSLECVTLENTGTDRVDLSGWKLRSVVGGEQFTFPAGYSIGTSQVIKIWSGSASMPAGPANLRWSYDPVWDEADAAQLIDASGVVVQTYSVGP